MQAIPAAGAAAPSVTVAALTPQAVHPASATLHPPMQRQAATGPLSTWVGAFVRKKMVSSTKMKVTPVFIFKSRKSERVINRRRF